MASVVNRDVRKAFGPTSVIHGVTFTIDDGQFVVLVGPSGCGKSTLCAARRAGKHHRRRNQDRRTRRQSSAAERARRAMVFQNYALYQHMTVAANMAFSMKLRGAPKPEIEQRVKRAADILGLQPCWNATRGSYRVASASASRWAARDRARSAGVFCSTSRCRTSTPRCACRCAPKSRSCIKG